MTPQTPRSSQPQNTRQAAAQNAAAQQVTAEKEAAAKAGAAKTAAEKAKAEAAAKAAAEQQAAADQSAAAAAEATDEAGSSVSPWLIGGGVLAAVGIGAAVSGGSSDKSDDNPVSQSPGTDKGNITQPDTSITPDNGRHPAAPDTGSGDSSAGAGNAGNTGNTGTPGADAGGTEQPGGQAPAPNPDQTHTAGGTADAPIVANNAVTSLSEASFRQSLTNGADAVRIVRILSAEGKDADGRVLHFFKDSANGQAHAYELIEVKEGISWHEAVDRAAAMGGKLLTIDSAEEARALAEQFSSRLPGTPYDAQSLATNGAWIGLSQKADASAPDADWHWFGGKAFTPADWQTYGFTLNGHKLPSDGKLADGAAEANQANFGILTAAYQPGADGAPGQFSPAMISDFGTRDTKLTHFVIEYENYEHPLKLGSEGTVADGQVIHADDLGKLSWASLLNSGGIIQIVGVKTNGAASDDTPPQTVAGTEHTLTLTEAAAGAVVPGATTAAPSTAQAIDLSRLLSTGLDDQTQLLS